MRYTILSLILLLSFSCKKENPKTLQDYTGTYIVESTKIKFTQNNYWICGTGMDSLQLHIEDSIRKLEADFWIDTISTFDTIKILTSENSENELLIEGLFDDFGDVDYCYFYNLENTKDLIYLYSNSDWVINENYSSKSVLLNDDIFFDFSIYRKNARIQYTYKGKAVRIK